jgi:hypothetical protein
MDKSNTNNNSDKFLQNINDKKIFIPLAGMLGLLSIFSLLLVFGFRPSTPSGSSSKSAGKQFAIGITSNEQTIANVMIIVFFLILIVIFCITLLPNLKDFKGFINQISSVIYVIFYTIFIILFFRNVPSNIINDYAILIMPITVLLTGYLFYGSYKTNYVKDFNINYERIKSIILFFCFITICIVLYISDPGGYIQSNSGPLALITILLAVFGFLYLIIMITLPDTNKPQQQNNSSYASLLEKFSKFSVFGTVLFALFLILITIGICTYPGGFFNNIGVSAGTMILLLLTCILWVIMLGVNLFPEIHDKKLNISKTDIFKKSLLALFGLTISGLIIAWLVITIQRFTGINSIFSLIINVLMVVTVLGLIYKTVYVTPKEDLNKGSLFDVIIKLIFYIPCLFTDIFNGIVNFVTNEYNSTTKSSLYMFALAIILFIIYFGSSKLQNLMTLQGGQLLINQPVYLYDFYNLGTFQKLNGSENPDYQYAISFWLFLDAMPPNSNINYKTYTSLLNFGNKPNILYKADTHSFIITMQQEKLRENTTNPLLEFDDNGNIIIYKSNKMLLQKWNNIVINYNGGTLDIFINNELVKTVVGVIPYMNNDSLTSGTTGGIYGGICNLVYYNKVLKLSNIYYSYLMVKDKTPPVSNSTNTTVVNQ